MRAVLLCVAWIAAGCPARSPGPADAGRAYLTALAEGRADEAWALLDADARRRLSVDEHRRRAAALTDAQRAALRRDAATLQVDSVQATWGSMRLQHRGGDAWIVSGPVPDYDRQDTPEAALATFARAFRARDYDLLVRFVPADRRDGVSADVLRIRFEAPQFRGEIEEALSALLSAGGGEATGKASWRFRSGRHRAELRREEGHWRLSDLR